MANKSDLFDFDETTASNNDNIQGANIAENCAPSGINNAIRGLASIVKRAIGSQGSAIASATTTPIGAPGTALYTTITGTTAIASFGTVGAGTFRIIEFTAALTLTHHATSLKLPGSANITSAPGDVAFMISLGSGNWKCLHYNRASGAPLAPISTSHVSDNAVTYAKMQDVSAASRLLGRGSASGAGDPQEITLGSGLSMSGAVLSAPDNFSTSLLHVRDEKSNGADGGTSATATWTTHTLNTVKANDIADASLSSNTITLPVGTYFVEGWLIGTRTGAAKARLRNTSDSVSAVVGGTPYDNGGGQYGSCTCLLKGRFSVAGAAKNFALQYYFETGLATFGLGRGVGSGEVEVYAELLIWKIA